MLRVLHLPCAVARLVIRASLHLQHRLAPVADAVKPALGDLAAERVDRHLAAQPDAAVLDPLVGLAAAAEVQAFQPPVDVRREAVVQHAGVDVLRLQVGARPQRPAQVHRGVVLPLLGRPVSPVPPAGAQRVHVGRLLLQPGGPVRARQDDRRCAVHRHVAIKQAQRIRDHAAVHVVLEGHRLRVEGRDRVLVRVGAAGDHVLRHVLAARAVHLHVAHVAGGEARGRVTHAVRRLVRVAGGRLRRLHRAVRGAVARAAAEGAGAGLVHRAPDQDGVGRAGVDRVDRGADGGGDVATAVRPPVDLLDAEALHHPLEARGAHARRGADARPGALRERGQPVNVTKREASILDRLQRRLDGERTDRAVLLPSDLGAPHAHDRHVPTCAEPHVRPPPGSSLVCCAASYGTRPICGQSPARARIGAAAGEPLESTEARRNLIT